MVMRGKDAYNSEKMMRKLVLCCIVWVESKRYCCSWFQNQRNKRI